MDQKLSSILKHLVDSSTNTTTNSKPLKQMGSKNNINVPINTSLGLGLRYDDDQEKEHQLLPSLTLSLSSSFSNCGFVVVKRENEERVVPVCSRDQEKEEGSPRKKLRLTKQQSATLEYIFKQQSTLNPKQKKVLAAQLNLGPRQVEVWFQNRRARTKLKQTEKDCEIVKKWWETLREENLRLHKELKALKLTTSVYMQLHPPPMCPCCKQSNS